ncbi:tyrosinase family protein [Shinella sp. S4-D37]|uniref:tyrosinase family protein n=1 Tax=Shinella sp. S4-D37 TaxID=3161999 RepID=UPI0034658190
MAAHVRKLVCYTDEPGQGGYGHNGSDLLTWHRAFLREFETAMTTVMGKPMAIPYWDWTDPESLKTVFAEDFMGPEGDPDQNDHVMSGPFRHGKWRLNVKGFESTNPGRFDYLVRAIGSIEGMALPVGEEVQQALARPQYDAAPWGVTADNDVSFRSFVDGMLNASGLACDGGAVTMVGTTATLLHGTVHMWVGGTTREGHPGSLADTLTSPNDPVFWLHHANTDRIAETWWAANRYEYLPRSGGPRGNNLNDRLWPYTSTSGDVVARPPSSAMPMTCWSTSTRARRSFRRRTGSSSAAAHPYMPTNRAFPADGGIAAALDDASQNKGLESVRRSSLQRQCARRR